MKETLGVVLENSDSNRMLIETFAESIARDHQMESESLDREGLFALMRQMLESPMGPKVEMRRWYTFWDAGWTLDTHWHTMLLALVAEYAMRGQDAWAVAQEARPAGEETDAERQTFAFKQQVLITLFNDTNQSVLRSMLVCFKRIRLHHGSYITKCTSPSECLRFLLFWSDEQAWLSKMMAPALRDSFDPAKLDFVGLSETVSPILAPLCNLPEEAGELQTLLVLHVRLAMGCMKHMLLYQIMPRSPPWCFCRLLSTDAGERQEQLATLKSMWQLTLELERSQEPFVSRLLKQMPFLRWAVYREPMLLLEKGQWDLASDFGQIAMAYIKALFDGILNTMALGSACR